MRVFTNGRPPRWPAAGVVALLALAGTSPQAWAVFSEQGATVLGGANFAGRSVSLADRALAVSGGYGTTLADGAHHIFDPHTGESAEGLVQVAVLAEKAAWADALSTAIYVAGEARAPGLLAAYPGSNAILSPPSSSTTESVTFRRSARVPNRASIPWSSYQVGGRT